MTTSPPIADTSPTDGRTARSLRTREAIVDATLALVNEGVLRPTGVQVADRAGVSVRSVFQHFDDLEGLFLSVGARAFERVAALSRPIDPAGTLLERSIQYGDQRCLMNEAITPVMKAALVHVHNSTTIARQIQDGHDIQRLWIEDVFAPELTIVGDRAGFLADALFVSTAWVSWSFFRDLESRSVDETTALIHQAMRATLAGYGLLPVVSASPGTR